MSARPYIAVLTDVPKEKLEQVIRDFTVGGAEVTTELQSDGAWKVTGQFPPEVVKKLRLGRV